MWNKRFAALRQFEKKHGHARVPTEFAGDPALGLWVSTQRRAYAAELERKAGREPSCARRISAARVKKLQRIRFEWVVVKPGMWDERFAALRRFVKEHGHARVPTEFADDPALGEWQRRAYAAELERKAGREPSCDKRISEARVKKLQHIRFEWVVVKPDMWDRRFAALRQFVNEHGHARVPTEFADDPASGKWVSRQRSAYAAELERFAGREPKCDSR
jgi:Helicase associated domain